MNHPHFCVSELDSVITQHIATPTTIGIGKPANQKAREKGTHRNVGQSPIFLALGYPTFWRKYANFFIVWTAVKHCKVSL